MWAKALILLGSLLMGAGGSRATAPKQIWRPVTLEPGALGSFFLFLN